MREEREISGLKWRRESIKNYYFVLELFYRAILLLELHYSTIAKKFAIVEFYNSKWSMVFVWKW